MKVKFIIIAILLFLLITLSIFMVTIIVITACMVPPNKVILKDLYEPLEEDPIPNSKYEKALATFRAGLRIPTISRLGDNSSLPKILEMHDLIIKSYPILHSSSFVTREVVNTYSLLYEIRGSNSSLDPALFIGHLDVVPTEEQSWTFDPFEASINEGYIVARGAIDAKSIVFGLLEAAEFMIESKIQPKRTMFLAFGHDEEISGFDGAQKIAERVSEKLGLRKLHFILDEGSVIIDGFMGIPNPIGIISVAEKGIVSFKMSVKGKGGHSSMPERDGAIEVLANAITKLSQNPQPSQLIASPQGLITDFLKRLGPYLPFHMRMAIANLPIFSGIVSKILSKNPSTNALVRTTTAVTIFQAGTKANVQPQEASAIVNHRISPGQTIDDVIEWDKDSLDDSRVTFTVLPGAAEHSRVSAYDEEAFAYQLLAATLGQMYPNVIVIPGLTVGATDSRWFANLTSDIYRLLPYRMSMDQLSKIHGTHEDISIVGYKKVIQFYYRLFRNMESVRNL